MAIEKLQDHLGLSAARFRADRAAAYLSMSTSTFLNLVEEGAMPKGIKVHGMTMWDRLELDAALDNLKERERDRRRNPIDNIMGSMVTEI